MASPIIGILVTIMVIVHLPASTYAKSVVCYFPNWATDRKGSDKFGVSNIDPKICTHLIYSFAVLDAKSLTMIPFDKNLDVKQGNYKKFTALKKKNGSLKTMLAIGGWSDSQLGDKYSRLVRDHSKRSKFIKGVVSFLKTYHFDGLDIDWEYPKTPQDKSGFTALVKELKAAFKSKGYLLTAAVSASSPAIDAGYDVRQISKYLDQIHLMSYDYHGTWEKQANYLAALYPDVDYSVKYWLKKGAPASKLIMGIPVYGTSWKLSSKKVKPPCPASGPGAGKYEKGNMNYNEICQSIKKGWKEVVDSSHKKEAYAYKLPNWVSYDDPTIAAAKGSYAKKSHLGGIMFWDLSGDDFNGHCGKGKNPIIHSARKAFCGNSHGKC